MGDEIYRPLIEGMRWSYSRVHSFGQCKYGWFLKYIHGSKKENKFYASYGSFMHRLLELYYRGLFSAQELLGVFLDRFSTDVKGERPSNSIVSKYIKAGVDCLRRLSAYPFRVVAVEERIEFTLDGIPMVAILDLVGQDAQGEYIIVDNKSRDLKPRSCRKTPTQNDILLDEMLRQLYIYAEAVRVKYGKFPKKLCFNCFKSGTFVEEPFQKERFDEAVRWLKDQVEQIRDTEDFPPTPEYFFCKYLCDVSGDCEYAGMC